MFVGLIDLNCYFGWKFVCRVGIKLPTVEVRYENLSVEADCQIGNRAIPSLPNVTRNLIESALSLVGINLAKTTKLTILKDLSGIVKPSRYSIILFFFKKKFIWLNYDLRF